MAAQKTTNGFITNLKIKLQSNKKLFIISCVVSLLGIPMFILGKVFEIYKTAQEKLGIYDYSYDAELYYIIAIAAMCILLIIVLISSFNMFHYLYNRPMVDVIYALPITTKQRFFSDYLAGLLTFAVPYIVSSVIALIINGIAFTTLPDWASTTFQSDIGSTSLILQACVCVLLIMLMLYTLSVLVLTCCGSIVESIGYNIIINAIIPIVSVIIFTFVETAAYGLRTSFTTTDFLEKTTVVGGLKIMYQLISSVMIENSLSSEFIYSDITLKWAVCYILLTAVIFGIAYFLYKKRKAEDVTKPFAFKAVYYIFMTCICFCMSAGIIMTSIYGKSFSTSIPWIIFSIVIFFILDTIQNRGFKKIKTGIIKYIAMTGSSLLLLMIIIWTNGFGSSFNVPSAEKVEKITLDYTIDLFSKDFYRKDSLVLTDTDEIKQIIDTHQYIVDDYQEFLDTKPELSERVNYTPTDYADYIEIMYTLKSGKEVLRAYNVGDDVFMQLKELYLSDANISNIISDLKEYFPENDRKENKFISVFDKFEYDFGIYMSKENYNQLLSAYEQDLKNADINDIINESETYCYIYNYAVLKSYTNTINYLNEIGVKITEEDSAEELEKYNFEQINIDTVITMNPSEIAKHHNSAFVSTTMECNYYDFNESAYNITLSNEYKEKFIEILLKSEPSYLTEDMNCVFIAFNGYNYILPSEYRNLAEEFISSLDKDNYHLINQEYMDSLNEYYDDRYSY